MTLEEALEEIRELGWLVNNMYQLDDKSWIVSLRSKSLTGEPTGFTGFAKNENLDTAIAEAMAMIADAEMIEEVEHTYIPQAMKEQSLLERLGLVQKVKRRI